MLIIRLINSSLKTLLMFYFKKESSSLGTKTKKRKGKKLCIEIDWKRKQALKKKKVSICPCVFVT